MSTLKVDHLRFYVDDDTDKLVNGYIHKIHEILSDNYNIPKEIIQLCILFYFQHMDEFDENVCAEGIKLQMTENGLTKAEKTLYGWKSIYGSIIIDPQKMKNCIIKWKIKCYSIGTDVFFSVGILPFNIDGLNDKLSKYCFCSKNYKYYAWTGYTVSDEHNGASINKLEYNDKSALVDLSDIIHKNSYVNQATIITKYDFLNSKDNYIDMILDLKMKTLKWLLNDVEYPKWIENIDISQQYKLGICVNDLKSVLEITQFEISYT